MYVFLGNYTRKYYIKIWDMVPLLKGVAYSIAVASLYIQFFNLTSATLAFHYMTHTISKSLPWTNCEFSRHSNECFVAYTGQNYTKKCCSYYRDVNCSVENMYQNSAKFSSSDYFYRHVMGIGYDNRPLHEGFITSLIINTEIMWTLLAGTLTDQKVCLLVLSLSGLFLYSLNRLRNDYHFYSGTILGAYWIIGVKAATLLIMLCAIGLGAHRATVVGKLSPIVITIIVPTIIGCILSSLRYALKITKTLVSPNESWGPPVQRQKIARNRFDPTHDLKYRSISHKCEHSCLLHSSALKKEVKYWLTRIQQVENQNEEDGGDSEAY
ncbi:hypothetical protein Trydic_g3072 [Trypoxylus dichotomus]